MTKRSLAATLRHQLAWALTGAACGLLAAAVALGVAELISAITGPQGSPVVAVGGVAIDMTPIPVKDFAIVHFGTHDKMVLITGILVLLALFAAVVGMLARRWLAAGLGGLAVFGALGISAALSRPEGDAADVAPTLAGVAVAMITLIILVRTARVGKITLRRLAVVDLEAAGLNGGTGTAGPVETAAPVRTTGTVRSASAWRLAGSAETVARPEPELLPGPDMLPGPEVLPGPGTGPEEQGAGPDELGTAPGGPAGPATGPGRPNTGSGGPGRRAFLIAGGGAAVVAAVSYGAGDKLLQRFSVTGSRDQVRLPAPVRALRPAPAGADLKIPGLSSFYTPNSSFHRVDTDLVLPQVSPSGWTLSISGMVEREIEIS